MTTHKPLILKKEHTIPFLRQAAKEWTIVAPIAGQGNDVIFNQITSVDDIVLDYKNSIMSPKHFFLPQVEVLFNYVTDKNGCQIKPHIDEEKRIIFGLRSCDVKAITILDNFFKNRGEDIYYLKRRENTLLISLVCNDPGENCFCLSLNTGPSLEKGFDLQLTDLKDRYFVEIGSEAGASLIEKFSHFFRTASKAEIKEQYEITLESKGKFKTHLDLSKATEKIKNGSVDESIWQELGKECQNCGGCAFVCPVCSCFNVVDRVCSSIEGERIRTWDACTFAGFTRMAGGHNPRQENKDRLKQRFYHKLYYYIENLGTYGCVGCGRCLNTCQADISLARVVELINKKE